MAVESALGRHFPNIKDLSFQAGRRFSGLAKEVALRAGYVIYPYEKRIFHEVALLAPAAPLPAKQIIMDATEVDDISLEPQRPEGLAGFLRSKAQDPERTPFNALLGQIQEAGGEIPLATVPKSFHRTLYGLTGVVIIDDTRTVTIPVLKEQL